MQKGIRSLERDNLIAGRFFGKTRIIQLNPSYFAAAELRALLNKLVEWDADLRGRAAGLRRRPRRTGKRL